MFIFCYLMETVLPFIYSTTLNPKPRKQALVFSAGEPDSSGGEPRNPQKICRPHFLWRKNAASAGGQSHLTGWAETYLQVRVCRLRFLPCTQSRFSVLQWTFPFSEGKATFSLFISLECCEDKLLFYSFRKRTVV